jgi:DNA-binding CsgD family transcriptional regulator
MLHRLSRLSITTRLALRRQRESLQFLLPEAILSSADTSLDVALAFVAHYQGDVLQIDQVWDFLVDALHECWFDRRFAEVVQLVAALAESAGRRPHLVEGMAVVRLGIAASRRCDDGEHEAIFLNRLGGLLVACGKYALGWRLWQAGHQLALAHGSSSVLWQPMISFALCIDMLGNKAQVQRLVVMGQALDDVPSLAVALLGRGLFARTTGDKDAAIADFTAVMHLFFNRPTAAVSAYQLFRAVVQSELARAQDQFAPAQMWAHTALHLAEVMSDHYTLATLLIDQGIFLIQQGNVTDVHAVYVRLRALNDKRGIPHMLERCRYFERYLVAHGAFATATVLIAATAVHAQETLSVRENEVLHLVAQGYSNREIAVLLVISRATVKKHLEHIYAQLGVHSCTAAVVKAKMLDYDVTRQSIEE